MSCESPRSAFPHAAAQEEVAGERIGAGLDNDRGHRACAFAREFAADLGDDRGLDVQADHAATHHELFNAVLVVYDGDADQPVMGVAILDFKRFEPSALRKE